MYQLTIKHYLEIYKTRLEMQEASIINLPEYKHLLFTPNIF